MSKNYSSTTYKDGVIQEKTMPPIEYIQNHSHTKNYGIIDNTPIDSSLSDTDKLYKPTRDRIIVKFNENHNKK